MTKLDVFRREMDYKMRFLKNRSFEPHKRGLMVLVLCACFLTLTMSMMARHYMISVQRLSVLLTLEAAPTTIIIQRRTRSNPSGAKNINQWTLNSACKDSSSGACQSGVNSTRELKSNSSVESGQDESNEDLKTQTKPMCDDSGPRSVVCELDGDIRIHGNSSSITVVTHSESDTDLASWKVKPHARKLDERAMLKVREVSLRETSGQLGSSPPCMVHHTVPAIVFSTGGHVGNIFHDFSDMLIPLYLTAHKYHREVQLLIVDMKPWFLIKHGKLLSSLSRYQVIDFDNDRRVHCFKTVTVGLRCHKDFSIDPLMHPVGYSMANFTQFLRWSYSLKRDAIAPGEFSVRRPRLLLITRKWIRTFTNEKEIVKMIKKVGFEVVVMEAGYKIGLEEFAAIVNSCDVMMGVHGAGLTNLIFLPVNATLIQVVPWGKMTDVAFYDYGRQAIQCRLNYLQYEISLEESSLKEKYPKDHPYIKGPSSVHKQGWSAVTEAYLKQNVKLDVRRFKPVLLEAIKHLKS